MKRFASKQLDQWLKNSSRKPMIIRGARQVGKTWLVHDLASRHKKSLIELNFEKRPDFIDLFTENEPEKILVNIEAEFDIHINLDESILFLDEIQAAPEIFSKLRWFKEDIPKLPVIAAGSLLEFTLNTFHFSMPVGRITYFYLEQMSFFEFILAHGKDALYKKLCLPDVYKKNKIPESLHKKCLNLYYEYCIVGGMPEVVKNWVQNKNIQECIKIQQDIISTYRDDFHKYAGKNDPRLLSKIFLSVAKQLGNKFVYTLVDQTYKVEAIKNAFNLLSHAKVCTKISHTSGNGLPLGAESNEKFFKTMMLDIGLVSAQLGLSSLKNIDLQNIILSNKGGLAEQFVGQQFRSAQSPMSEPQLFYWQKIGGGQAEIDYIIQYGNKIIPVEVKSGASGSMKSLHYFMYEKKLNLAVRLNVNMPEEMDIDVKTTQSKNVKYKLISLPIYLAERIYHILDE